jgi:hypothetical protein
MQKSQLLVIFLHTQAKQYEAVIDFVGEEPGDLSFKAGEILYIHHER